MIRPPIELSFGEPAMKRTGIDDFKPHADTKITKREWLLLAISAAMALAYCCLEPKQSHAADRLSGPVDFAMLSKANQAQGPVEIASNGGNMLASMAIAADLKARNIPVRVTGWCASGCAMIAIGSGHCTVAPSGRLALHGPVIPAGTLGASETARALEGARSSFRTWASANGIPSDLIERTFQAYEMRLELNEYQMRRVGCTVE